MFGVTGESSFLMQGWTRTDAAAKDRPLPSPTDPTTHSNRFSAAPPRPVLRYLVPGTATATRFRSIGQLQRINFTSFADENFGAKKIL